MLERARNRKLNPTSSPLDLHIFLLLLLDSPIFLDLDDSRLRFLVRRSDEVLIPFEDVLELESDGVLGESRRRGVGRGGGIVGNGNDVLEIEDVGFPLGLSDVGDVLIV